MTMGNDVAGSSGLIERVSGRAIAGRA